MSTTDDIGLRQLRRRGGGYFVEHQKQRDLNELKASIVLYEQDPFCMESRNRLTKIRMYCVRYYLPEEIQQATIEAYTSIRK